MTPRGGARRWLAIVLGTVVLMGALANGRDPEDRELTGAARRLAPGEFVYLPDGATHYEEDGASGVGPRDLIVRGAVGEIDELPRGEPSRRPGEFAVLRITPVRERAHEHDRPKHDREPSTGPTARGHLSPPTRSAAGGPTAPTPTTTATSPIVN
ncbi:MAG: hypothetical protein ACKOH8_01895 [Gemmatimonadota bacterium]